MCYPPPPHPLSTTKNDATCLWYFIIFSQYDHIQCTLYFGFMGDNWVCYIAVKRTCICTLLTYNTPHHTHTLKNSDRQNQLPRRSDLQLEYNTLKSITSVLFYFNVFANVFRYLLKYIKGCFFYYHFDYFLEIIDDT